MVKLRYEIQKLENGLLRLFARAPKKGVQQAAIQNDTDRPERVLKKNPLLKV